MYQHSGILFIALSAGPMPVNKDWMPGPYPETQAEREAAAKKYGLRLEDYEPHDPSEG